MTKVKNEIRSVSVFLFHRLCSVTSVKNEVVRFVQKSIDFHNLNINEQVLIREKKWLQNYSEGSFTFYLALLLGMTNTKCDL